MADTVPPSLMLARARDPTTEDASGEGAAASARMPRGSSYRARKFKWGKKKRGRRDDDSDEDGDFRLYSSTRHVMTCILDSGSVVVVAFLDVVWALMVPSCLFPTHDTHSSRVPSQCVAQGAPKGTLSASTPMTLMTIWMQRQTRARSW